MTHTSTEQPEALRLARWLEHRSMSGIKPNDLAASTELRRLHARVQELEASQAQRVPLSEAQISVLNMQSWKVGGNVTKNFARLIEAAHGITQEKQG